MTEPQAQGTLPRLAAIDVGTNTIRLVVVEVSPDGHYRVLDEEREMTRLGRGLAASGRLGRAPMERSLEALGKMRAIAEGFGVRELRAVATSAVREAANGATFRRNAERRCGVRLEIISPAEEAELAFKSVSHHFRFDGRSIAVVDIGGGSVEVVLAAGGIIERVYSLPLGAVRLTERYVQSAPLGDEQWRKLRRAIDKALKREIGRPPSSAEVMIGSGGTFTNLGGMVQCERDGRVSQVRGYVVTRADLQRLLDRLRETTLAQRRRLCGLNPKRADIILAGVAAVARLARRLGTQQIVVNDGGIRDGLVVSMIESLGLAGTPSPAAPRDRMELVRDFARQCRSNERHCTHVAGLAVQLFDALREPFAMPAHGREILEAAALLHDVGYLINHAKHHKHAYHLIVHGNLHGFSPAEVELVANVARYHRRALPIKAHENFARLDGPERLLVRQLSGILRVADGLDRTHGRIVTAVRVRVSDGLVRVFVDAASDPRVELGDAARKSGLFEQAFGVALELAWVRPRRVRRRRASRAARSAAAEAGVGS